MVGIAFFAYGLRFAWIYAELGNSVPAQKESFSRTVVVSGMKIGLWRSWEANARGKRIEITSSSYPACSMVLVPVPRPPSFTSVDLLFAARSLFGESKGAFRFRSFRALSSRAWHGYDWFDGWSFHSVGRGMVLTPERLVFFDWSVRGTNGKGGKAIADLMATTATLDAVLLDRMARFGPRQADHQASRGL